MGDAPGDPAGLVPGSGDVPGDAPGLVLGRASGAGFTVALTDTDPLPGAVMLTATVPGGGGGGLSCGDACNSNRLCLLAAQMEAADLTGVVQHQHIVATRRADV